MAKNDYFVIAYKILTYLYGCFQAGTKSELSQYSAEALGINRGYWRNVIESLTDEKYITGTEAITRSMENTPIGYIERFLHTKITQGGIAFLAEDNLIAEAKKYVKAAKNTDSSSKQEEN